MLRQCRVAGCRTSAVSRYSIYCSRHRARLRRHGAVDQETITTADLKPHLRLVRARIEKNADNPLWAQLDQRWEALADHARDLVAHTGPMARHERQAAHEVIKLATAVPPRDVAETVLALFLMEELEQRRFKSDRAFRTQLVRRVRGLTDLNAGMWFDHRSGKTKRVYRDLPPRAATMMARWLIEVFGMAGLKLARLEQAETDRRQSERQALHEAASRLT